MTLNRRSLRHSHKPGINDPWWLRSETIVNFGGPTEFRDLMGHVFPIAPAVDFTSYSSVVTPMFVLSEDDSSISVQVDSDSVFKSNAIIPMTVL